MTISVVEETTTSLADNNRACSNGRSGEDECGSSKEVRTGKRGLEIAILAGVLGIWPAIVEIGEEKE